MANALRILDLNEARGDDNVSAFSIARTCWTSRTHRVRELDHALFDGPQQRHHIVIFPPRALVERCPRPSDSRSRTSAVDERLRALCEAVPIDPLQDSRILEQRVHVRDALLSVEEVSGATRLAMSRIQTHRENVPKGLLALEHDPALSRHPREHDEHDADLMDLRQPPLCEGQLGDVPRRVVPSVAG